MEFERIANRQSAAYKHLARLVRDKKYRKSQGEMVCEGWKMLEEALRSGVVPKLILCEDTATAQPLLAQAAAQGARMLQADAALFGEISDVETPQGVLFACASPVVHALPPNLANAIVLDGLQDPGNLGTVLRSADAFALDAVILAEGCVDIAAPKTVRSTMGAIFRQTVVQMPLVQAIDALHAQGIAVYAAALEPDSQPLTAMAPKTAVIIGNEGNGVTQAALTHADGKIIIPMAGSAESLNAGVAASIFIWEMGRSGTETKN